MYPDLAEASTTSTQTMIVGVAPVAGFEMPEMSFGAENDCKCGSNCTCTNCGCGK
ncbi:Metallothionein-like protein type 2 [Linum grandiflorum]